MGSEDILLEAGKSSELSAALSILAEAEIDGEAKYTSKMCREVGKLIVCRTYSTAVLELCHLVRAGSFASIMPGRYEYLFWDSGIAQASNFHRYFENNYNYDFQKLITVNSKGVTLHYEDGAFSVYYSRMPVLSAFMEFLLSSIGFAELDKTFQPLFAKIDQQGISKVANKVSRILYDYLKDHLPTAQSQKKFRKIIDFCHGDIDQIDDQLVLDFWKDTSNLNDKSVDFKTYESVFISIVRVIQAIEAARDLHALQHAGSIGMEMESGEINPEHLSETLEQIDETASPLKDLSEEPINQIKFLNKQECANLETLISAGAIAFRLPLSVLRANIFAKPQNKLTQALRIQANDQDISEIIAEGPVETYLERQSTYQGLCSHMKNVAYASLYGLIQARSPFAINLLLDLHPGLNYQALSECIALPQETGNVVSINPNAIAQQFLDQLHDPEKLGEELVGILDHARKCHKKIQRKGFQNTSLTDEDHIQGLSEGSGLILNIRNDVEAFIERLENIALTGGGWEAQYSLDRTIFSGQFNMMYGGIQ